MSKTLLKNSLKISSLQFKLYIEHLSLLKQIGYCSSYHIFFFNRTIVSLKIVALQFVIMHNYALHCINEIHYLVN